MVFLRVAGRFRQGIWLRRVLSHPYFVFFLNPGGFPTVIKLHVTLGRVKHPLIPQPLNSGQEGNLGHQAVVEEPLGQEGQRRVRSFLLAHFILTAVGFLKSFAVINNRVSNGILGQNPSHPFRFLFRLRLGYGS